MHQKAETKLKVKRITCLGGWSVPPTSMGCAAAGGGGGGAAGVLGGRRSFDEVAGAPPVLRGQSGASLTASEREVVFLGGLL